MLDRRTPYAFGAEVDLSFDDAMQRTKDALAAEGFGILCEIDVSDTLRRKLGAEMPPYVILGACNPPLAQQALAAEPDIGLLLPCNVVVYATGDAGTSVVAAIDPETAMTLSARAELEPIAAQVAAKLRRALRTIVGDATVAQRQTAGDVSGGAEPHVATP